MTSPKGQSGFRAEYPIAVVLFFVLIASALFPATFPLACTATTLFVLSRRLPIQNVLAIALIIALISGLVELVGWQTSPFFQAGQNAPAREFDWIDIPLAASFWIVATVNSRGVARLAVHLSQKTCVNGFVVLGLAGLLVVVFAFLFAANPLFSRIFWLRPPFSELDKLSAFSRLLDALWIMLNALVILVVAAPWFIDKRRVEQSPDFLPLLLWVLFILLAPNLNTPRTAYQPEPYRGRSAGFQPAVSPISQSACRSVT